MVLAVMKEADIKIQVKRRLSTSACGLEAGKRPKIMSEEATHRPPPSWAAVKVLRFPLCIHIRVISVGEVRKSAENILDAGMTVGEFVTLFDNIFTWKPRRRRRSWRGRSSGWNGTDCICLCSAKRGLELRQSDAHRISSVEGGGGVRGRVSCTWIADPRK